MKQDKRKLQDLQQINRIPNLYTPFGPEKTTLYQLLLKEKYYKTSEINKDGKTTLIKILDISEITPTTIKNILLRAEGGQHIGI